MATRLAADVCAALFKYLQRQRIGELSVKRLGEKAIFWIKLGGGCVVFYLQCCLASKQQSKWAEEQDISLVNKSGDMFSCPQLQSHIWHLDVCCANWEQKSNYRYCFFCSMLDGQRYDAIYAGKWDKAFVKCFWKETEVPLASRLLPRAAQSPVGRMLLPTRKPDPQPSWSRRGVGESFPPAEPPILLFQS